MRVFVFLTVTYAILLEDLKQFDFGLDTVTDKMNVEYLPDLNHPKETDFKM